MDNSVETQTDANLNFEEDGDFRISLNRALREYLESRKNDYHNDCPLCQGKNPNCRYFKLDSLTEIEHALQKSSNSPLKGRYSLEKLEQIKSALGGKIITVTVSGIEYDYPLGLNLILTSRTLDLLEYYPQFPFLRDIGNRLGIYHSLNGKENDANNYRSSFQAFLLQSDQFDFNRLTADSRTAIINVIQDILIDLSSANESYDALQLVPVQAPEGRQNADDWLKSFAELIEMKRFLQLEEEIYERLSDMEEWIISNSTEAKGYLCSEPGLLGSEIVYDFETITAEIQAKIE
jgi:hypothetical protein